MPADSARVILRVPGLCGPAGGPLPETCLPAATPALDRIMSRARITAAPGGPPTDLFSPLPGESLPAAALSRLADTGEAATGYLLRVDPVHVRADRASLRLFDAATFELAADEAAALVDAFNAHFEASGWRLEAPHPARWYLALAEAPELVTVAPGAVAGEDIDRFLPAGRDGKAWHAVMNEVQMLFHDHPVNVERAARGALPVNSVWPWGGGVLPAPPATPLTRVLGGDPVLAGLADLAGCARGAAPATAAGLPRGGITLVQLDDLDKAARYGEVEAWAAALARLEADWFTPLLADLAAGRLARLVLYPGRERRAALTRRRLACFWKRARRFSYACGHA